MKLQTKIPVSLMAFFAIAVLVFLPYTDCKERCSRLRNMSCHIEKTQKTNKSDCCSHTQPQPKSSSSEKCKGACCISNLPPSATTQNQNITFNNQSVSDICESQVFTESAIILKTVISTANSPPYPHNETQAMLCVFII